MNFNRARQNSICQVDVIAVKHVSLRVSVSPWLVFPEVSVLGSVGCSLPSRTVAEFTQNVLLHTVGNERKRTENVFEIGLIEAVEPGDRSLQLGVFTH